MTDMERKALKVGDRVGLMYGTSRGDTTSIQFGTVHKVHKNGGLVIARGATPAGDGMIEINPSGRERGRMAWSGGWRVVSVDAAEKCQEREAARKYRNAAWTAFAERFEAVRRNHRNGYGDQSGMTAAEHAELTRLLNTIPVETPEPPLVLRGGPAVEMQAGVVSVAFDGPTRVQRPEPEYPVPPETGEAGA